jgi:hypothetical protein
MIIEDHRRCIIIFCMRMGVQIDHVVGANTDPMIMIGGGAIGHDQVVAGSMSWPWIVGSLMLMIHGLKAEVCNAD